MNITLARLTYFLFKLHIIINIINNPLSPHHFNYIAENRFNFPTTKGFRRKISMKLAYQYIAIFFTFSTTLNNLHPLQVENCESSSVVDEDDNGKFRLERVKVNNGLKIRSKVITPKKAHNYTP